jgi:hypothetical protein
MSLNLEHVKYVLKYFEKNHYEVFQLRPLTKNTNIDESKITNRLV